MNDTSSRASQSKGLQRDDRWEMTRYSDEIVCSKISFPSAYAVLMLVILLGAAMTWVLPAGRYDLLRHDQAHRTFVAERATGEETLSAEQTTLDQLGIQIQLRSSSRFSSFTPCYRSLSNRRTGGPC